MAKNPVKDCFIKSVQIIEIALIKESNNFTKVYNFQPPVKGVIKSQVFKWAPSAMVLDEREATSSQNVVIGVANRPVEMGQPKVVVAYRFLVDTEGCPMRQLTL